MSIGRVQGNHKKSLGEFGEKVAAVYLVRTLGWTILFQNWRCREGEIDIVALDRESLVAVEVRTRGSTRTGSAIESVDFRKQRQLLRVTRRLLMDPSMHELLQPQHGEIPIRIDVVGILLSARTVKQFIHIRNAVQVS